MQLTVPVAVEYIPVEQPMHKVEAEAPVVDKYCPEAHPVHPDEPAVAA